MIGHENAYKVCWPKRSTFSKKLSIGAFAVIGSLAGNGFARIATQAEVPIVPIFLANVEEMRWNPFLFFWNLFGLGRLFSFVLKLELPIIGPILVLFASTVWFIVTFFQIPLPAKVTLYIGDPVQYDTSKDSLRDVSFNLSSDNR